MQTVRRLIREMLDADISDELRDLADEDQKLRALWARALQGAGGWTAMTPEERDALRERFTEEHGTTLDDMFGDKSRHKRILDLPSKIRWSSLSDPDWNNLWLITQHMDQFPDFQERMLGMVLSGPDGAIQAGEILELLKDEDEST